MRFASAMLAVMAFVAVSACDRLYSNLLIRNDGSSRISDIVLEYGDNSSKIADLEPGSKTEFNKRISGEGAIVIRYTSRGRRFFHEVCYYTGGMPPHGKVVIRDGTVLRYCR